MTVTRTDVDASRRASIRALRPLHPHVRWMAWHAPCLNRACASDPDEWDFYYVDISELSTPNGLDLWTRHILSKKWGRDSDWMTATGQVSGPPKKDLYIATRIDDPNEWEVVDSDRLEDGHYAIPVNELSDPLLALKWTLHIADKGWLTKESTWREALEQCLHGLDGWA